MASVSPVSSASRLNLPAAARSHAGHIHLRHAQQPLLNRGGHGRSRGDHENRNVARRQQPAVRPHHHQQRFGEAALPQVPHRRGHGQHQHRFEENRRRVVEARREEFHDVLRIPRVPQVLRHVHVQVVRVRVDQAGCQAGQAAQKIAARLEPRRPPVFAVRREHHPQRLAAAVRHDHQHTDEETAVQVGPENRDRRKRRQNRYAQQARAAFAHQFQRAHKRGPGTTA